MLSILRRFIPVGDGSDDESVEELSSAEKAFGIHYKVIKKIVSDSSPLDPGSSAQDFFKQFLIFSFSIKHDSKGFAKFTKLIER